MGTEILDRDSFHEILTDAMTISEAFAADGAATTITRHDAALRARLAEVEKERDEAKDAADTYLRELCDCVGVINDDDGPPSEEYALGDVKTGVLLTIAAKEKAEGDLTAALADVARLAFERDTISAELEKLEIAWGGLAAERDSAISTSRQMREALVELVEAMRLWGAEEDGIPEDLGKASRPFASWERAKALLAATALSASPCDAKVECEGCKRMRAALAFVAREYDGWLNGDEWSNGCPKTGAEERLCGCGREAKTALAAPKGGEVGK